MSLVRFQEIKRYLKISNPLTDGDSMSADWPHKIEPLLSDVLNASKRHLYQVETLPLTRYWSSLKVVRDIQ